jgi:hypothetical protein
LDGEISRIIIICSAFIVVSGQINGSLNNSKLRRIIEVFALINVILIVIQVLGYYLLHLHIQYIPRSIVYEEYQNSYVFREFTGLYRPSALFLEPSHFSQYCVFALISSLFPAEGKVKIKKAVAIGMGIVLTTSGMGIVLSFAVFAWYLVLNRRNAGNKVATILKLIPLMIVLSLVLLRTTFFQTALRRVFSTVEGYNAVSGRLHNWDNAIGTMSYVQLWFGYGDSQSYELYLTGLSDSIYKYGIVSVILEGLCFLYLMVKKVNNYVWCCSVVFLILFCVAHLTNFVSQVFYFGMIIAEARTKGNGAHGNHLLITV